jgi:hypothetical protein
LFFITALIIEVTAFIVNLFAKKVNTPFQMADKAQGCPTSLHRSGFKWKKSKIMRPSPKVGANLCSFSNQQHHAQHSWIIFRPWSEGRQR